MSGVRHLLKSNQYNQLVNKKYKTKYRRLKRIIKNYVFENAALCDQIAQIQENISIIKDERSFLLKKLMEFEDAEMQLLNTTATSNIGLQQNPTVPGKRGPKKRVNIDGVTSKSKGNSGNQQSGKISSSAAGGTVTGTSKQKYQQTIITDQQGHPIFPINLSSSLKIHSIGEIVPENTNFHTENWIYPVGYIATRIYLHPREPELKCTFTCKILNNSGIPQFQIIPDSDYDHVFFGESANICHLGLLETIVQSSDIKNLPLRAQGEIFFGLGHKTVKNLLQSMPNIKKCPNFKGFLPDLSCNEEDKDPTLSFDAIQKLKAISVYHTVPEIKAEPPDELLE